MKRFLYLFTAIIMLSSCGAAKSVSYTHRPLAAEGCSVSYSTVQNDGQIRIVVTVRSDRLVFVSNPMMMLKNFKGEVLKLEGVNSQSRSETAGVLVNNMVLPVNELNAMAEFPVAEKDIDFFASGISKVRLSTIPLVHEKEFSRDIIGTYLFKSLSAANTSEESF